MPRTLDRMYGRSECMEEILMKEWTGGIGWAKLYFIRDTTYKVWGTVGI